MSNQAASPLMRSLGKQSNRPRWQVGCYYQANFRQYWRASLDEEFEEPLEFPPETVFLVERAEERSVVVGDDDDEMTSSYVVFRTLDPRDLSGESTLRFGFWPTGGLEIRNGYSLIDEPLVILALAGTGLAL